MSVGFGSEIAEAMRAYLERERQQHQDHLAVLPLPWLALAPVEPPEIGVVWLFPVGTGTDPMLCQGMSLLSSCSQSLSLLEPAGSV